MKKNTFLKIVFAWVLMFSAIHIQAQTCFSGGTGADGAYNATVSGTLVGGTYNFTTFNISSGVVINVTGTQPLIIHCTGAVTIDGTLSANGGNGSDGVTFSSSGLGGIGVAGGHNGGAGSFSSSSGPLSGVAGSGPGGAANQGDAWSGGGGAGYAAYGDSSGNPSGGFGGVVYGNIMISDLAPGSGGGGGSGGFDCGAGGGGAGGGVIAINSNVSITIGATGIVSANGGNGGSDGTGNCGGGGAGSGGAIWVAAPTMVNNGLISAAGGTGGASNVPGTPYWGTGANGSDGRIRLDYDGTMSGSGTITPVAGYHYAVYFSQNITQCPHTTYTTNGHTYSAAGTYHDTLTDVNGCDSILVTNLSFYTVDVSTSVNLTTITAGEGGGTYQWLDCNAGNAIIPGATGQSYNATTNGSYAVVVSIGGCSDTSACVIINCVGISNADPIATLHVFPNPGNGLFQVEVNGEYELQVINVLGEIIMTDKIRNQKTIDLTAQPSGSFILRLKSDKQILNTHLVIQ
ncbi:MAG: T9SS type A sorting domain-containing protein [Bacteroidota bacterium]